MTKWGEGNIERVCEFCKETFITYKAWTKGRGGRGGIFCSIECRIKGRKSKGITFIEFICRECDKPFKRRKGGTGKGNYCSRKCAGLARSRLFSGANHPCWRGGISERTHADRIIIKRAIRLTGKCEHCGSTERLQGHHKKSYADFPELRKDPKNIEVVCEDCHAKEHPELEAFIRKIPHKQRFEKVCIVCGKQYKTKSEKSLFCSHVCLFSLPPSMRKIKWQKNGSQECT